MNKKIKILIPIFFGFYVMGFVDFTGIAISYIKAEFAGQMPDHFFGFLATAVFYWFLMLSIPTAMAMNKIGRKNTVLASAAITLVSAILPFAFDSIWACAAGFALLGIGNVVLQVSLMPLLASCINSDKLASAQSAGQSIKAVSSFASPFIALYAASAFGSWKLVFPFFAVITIVFGVWLYSAEAAEEKTSKSVSIKKVFGLLADRQILPLFIGIVAVCGMDMGLNMGSTMVLMEKLGLDPSLESSVRKVGFAPSVYFAARTFGTFVGAALLAKMDSFKYFKIHSLVALAGLALILFAKSEAATLAGIALAGYGISSIFSVVFSRALTLRPDSENEISGIMITGIAGCAIVPPLMTFAQAEVGITIGTVAVLALACAYLIFCSFKFAAKH